MVAEDALRVKYRILAPLLDERSLRVCLAAEASALGYGGVSRGAKAAGVSRTTVHAGMQELRRAGREAARVEERRRIRRPGGGRKRQQEQDETLLSDLDRLLDPVTRGDPMSPLRWTCKSTTKLAAELRDRGHRVSQATVWRLLDDLRYSMQSNRKTREGSDHPDRNAQFEFIGTSVSDFLQRGLPVVSVDTQKKELIGRFKNKRPRGRFFPPGAGAGAGAFGGNLEAAPR